MTHVILDRRQLSLEYATDCIIVRAPEQPPRTLPLSRIDQVICMHSVQLTTQLIGQLQSRGIDLIVLNQRHEQNSFALFANQQRQVERRCRQYAWQQSLTRRLPIAVQFCRHKFNILNRLLTHTATGEALHQHIEVALRQLGSCEDDAQLRGIEGSVQRLAFAHWREQLPPQLGFSKRERRPPPDPVNAALSLTYTLVHQEAVRQSLRYALDPQLGFYHRPAYGRKSLACDLMEPLRPQVETWVVRLFNSGLLDRRHFSTRPGGCLLGKEGRQQFYAAYDEVSTHWSRQLGAGAHWLSRRIDRDCEEALCD
ncbi:CRISPR-associated endonuclease Cas1 [Marinobacterium aestuarii]|uniref:CRISPR-associated endonuclease Cas1 n=1 Tax=Marinobacterium aestuarii TaxID=1821621 RepID=A0A1A9EWH3_9GAMM|nr:CRISPR-associated endonuclease Cas1 [Marinobacterium aestuarii]ANG62225.1 CRISPR-associated endonuclease Cas1 [Marinobacterium aestuarii]